jgi:hypothetical protein
MACFLHTGLISNINGVLETNISETRSVAIMSVDIRQTLKMGPEQVSETFVLDHQ